MSLPDTVKQGLPAGPNEHNQNQKEKQTYSAWAKDTYNSQYESWMPWIEDQYLRWFGKGHNKASYATKDSLSKTKVTGIDQVDQAQDDASNLVGNQIGDNGLLKPVGQALSKEGINRAERNGKDDKGQYLGDADDKGGIAKSIGDGVSGGVKSVGGLLGGK